MTIVLKEVLGEALPFITKFAPSLGGIIGGPAGVAGGLALSVLAKAFNTHPSDFRGLVSNIINDPNVQDKLNAVEKENGTWLSSLMEEVRPPSHVEVNIKMDWESSSNGR